MRQFRCSTIFKLKRQVLKATTVLIVCFVFFGLLWTLTLVPVSYAAEVKSKEIFTDQEVEWIRNNPVIYYAPDPNYAPFEFVEEGVVKGIAADYIKAIADISGLKFEPTINVEWSDSLRQLVSKDVDLILATPDDVRKEKMLFSMEIIRSVSVIIVRQDNDKIQDMDDLTGARIAIINGYITSDLLTRDYPLIQQVNYKTTDAALASVAFGETDATIVDIGSASYSIQKNTFSNLKISGEAPFSSSLAFAIRKDYTDLQSIINKSLMHMPQKEKQKILDRWITLRLHPTWSKEQIFMIMGIAVLIALAVWIWVAVLRFEVKKSTLSLTITSKTLETVMDQVPHLIFVKNLQGQFVMVNTATALYYNTTKQGLVGKTHDDFYNGTSHMNEALIARDASIVEHDTFLNIPVETTYDLSGNLHYFNVYKRSIQLEGEPYLCALTVAVDITDEIEAKQAYQLKEEALKQAEYHISDMEKKATLGSLVAGITHEINNPIGISVTALSHLTLEFENFKSLVNDQLLTKENLNEFITESDEALMILKNNIERAVNMVSSFKQMSVDQLSEAKSEFNLCDTIKHVIDSLKYECKRKGVQVVFQCHDAIWLSSYPGSYSQVLTNLLMNSLIHAFENQTDGLVTIDSKIENNEVVICYTDNGIGMNQELLKKVWQPYFTTKRNEGGSGLGMQIIYNIIVRTLKGTINFTSKPNQGVYCEMRVPIKLNLQD